MSLQNEWLKLTTISFNKRSKYDDIYVVHSLPFNTQRTLAIPDNTLRDSVSEHTSNAVQYTMKKYIAIHKYYNVCFLSKSQKTGGRDSYKKIKK